MNRVGRIKFNRSWDESRAYQREIVLRELILPVYNAFASSFPSLPTLGWDEGCFTTGFSPAAILYGLHSPYHTFHRVRAYMALLDECSVAGQWPATFAIDTGLFEAIPYVGDRRLTIQWADNNVTVTADYSRRPSLVAARRVVELAAKLGGNIEYAAE